MGKLYIILDYEVQLIIINHTFRLFRLHNKWDMDNLRGPLDRETADCKAYTTAQQRPL